MNYTLNAFYQQRRYVSNIIKTSKKTTMLTRSRKIRTNSKWSFRLPTSYYIGMKPPPLPLMDDKKLLADQFNEFFVTKIDRIMDSLSTSDTNSTNDKYIEQDFLTSLHLTNFRPIMLQGTIDLIRSAAPKSCELDPIQTSIILKHVEIIAPTIQKIINLSITTGIMPGNMKESIL